MFPWPTLLARALETEYRSVRGARLVSSTVWISLTILTSFPWILYLYYIYFVVTVVKPLFCWIVTVLPASGSCYTRVVVTIWGLVISCWLPEMYCWLPETNCWPPVTICWAPPLMYPTLLLCKLFYTIIGWVVVIVWTGGKIVVETGILLITVLTVLTALEALPKFIALLVIVLVVSTLLDCKFV